MTGPELFRESQSLAHDDPGCACEVTCCIHEQVQLQRAQVLATLALAAATADLFTERDARASAQAWNEVMQP